MAEILSSHPRPRDPAEHPDDHVKRARWPRAIAIAPWLPWPRISGRSTIHVVELSPEAVSQARAVLLRHPLRAADAVQLASALVLRDRLRARIAFLTFDARLATASEIEGLSRELP